MNSLKSNRPSHWPSHWPSRWPSRWVDWSFRQRQGFLGNLKLRRGLPAPETSQTHRLENQYYANLLKPFLTGASAPLKPSQLKWVLDVGCRNWSYLEALGESFPHAELSGVELDGNARYWNLYRRQDQARANALHYQNKSGRKISFSHSDLRAMEFSDPLSPVFRESGLITLFYPFVSKAPCVGWGLPESFNCLGELVDFLKIKTQTASTPQWLFSCHQGPWEEREALRIFESRGLQPLAKNILPEPQYLPPHVECFKTHALLFLLHAV